MIRGEPKRLPTEFGFPGEAFVGAGMEHAQAYASVAAQVCESLHISPRKRQDGIFRSLEPGREELELGSLTCCIAPPSNAFRVSGNKPSSRARAPRFPARLQRWQK